MSNDSREAFEAWAVDYGHSIERHPDRPRYYLHDEVEDSWRAWSGNESRHAAEREALVKAIKEIRAHSKLSSESLKDGWENMEGMQTSYTDTGFVNAQAITGLADKILALLDSGSQG
jgi:hypothetical protein